MIDKNPNRMFQVSALQALAMGYSRTVIPVSALLQHGDTGIGTFEDVDGEMILIDGHPFRADGTGAVTEAVPSAGVPFCAVTFLETAEPIRLSDIPDMDALKDRLDHKIREEAGRNSMFAARIDGFFTRISARSVSPYRADHVRLKEILEMNQKEFVFSETAGSLVCIYFPDYMDGINAAGWHMHFVSEDRKKGGHVLDLSLKEGTVYLNKISCLEIRLPGDPEFDTYSLKEASGAEIREIEQGKSPPC